METTIIEQLPAKTYNRILSGVLFTAEKTFYNTLLSIEGNEIKIIPFDHETHTTAFISRVAIVDSTKIEHADLIPLQSETEIAVQNELLSTYLAKTTSPAATIISLSPLYKIKLQKADK